MHGLNVNEDVLEVELDDEGESGWTEERDEFDWQLTEEGTKEAADYMTGTILSPRCRRWRRII